MAKQPSPANPISQRQATPSKATSRSTSHSTAATATATSISANSATSAWKGGYDNRSSATTSTVESDYSTSDLSATSASFNPTFSASASVKKKNKGGTLTLRTESSSFNPASTKNNNFMMATGHGYSRSYASYGYEDATPDVANRFNGNPYTPPQHANSGDYGWPNDMGERHSSYHSGAGAGDPTQQLHSQDISGINLHEFDNATSLDHQGGPHRATMPYPESFNAPPGFTPGAMSRSRSGSGDSDFLTSLISNSPQDNLQPAPLHRRISLQEDAYSNNDLVVGMTDPMAQFATAHRRNSLQEALARSGSNPPEQMQHRQQPNAAKWDNHHHHGGDPRRSSLPNQNSVGRQGSTGYNQGGAVAVAARNHRYDQQYHGATGTGYGNQPRAPPPTGPFYTVKLKRNQRTFVLGPRIKSKLVTGTYVKVEADRGEDLGIVIGEATQDQLETPSRRASYGGFEQQARRSSGSRDGGRDQPKKILRLATREEVALLATRRQEEDEMHQLCIQKVRERGLDMRIVDAEYQFDRNKLTFYFEAERRVDFRDLVRELFMICGTRIWMCQINTYATSTASRPSNEAQDEEDVNVPIIAPPSEFLS